MPDENKPTFAEAFRFWLKLGFISFGGPAGQIAIMQHELVEKRRWVDQSRFLHALNFCMLLPGPEAQQLAIYIGWLLHRTLGGIVAGSLFVLPSVFILWGLSAIYASYGNVPWIAAIFYGLKPAVMAIVAVALIRIGRKALTTWLMWLIAALAFIAIYWLHVPYPVVVLGALLIGFVARRTSHETAGVIQPPNESSWRRSLGVVVVCLAIWWTPIIAAGLWHGWDSTFFREGVFFAKAAVITFGGAYAVLPYVAEHAMNTYGWLQTGQMMDGLGLAETTPGPFIMVLQFVGFMGGWHNPGTMSPLVAATLGALITTWATFTPCFLWIFLGAPYIERLGENEKLRGALSTVTAAVLGVILSLAVWFGLHVIFPPGRAVDWFAVAICALAFIGMLKWRWDVVPVVLGSGLAGLIYRVVVGL